MTRYQLFRPTLNKKLVAMMLFLSLSLICALIFLYYRTEQAMFNEFQRQTAELSTAIQIGLEDAITSGLTDERKLQGYLEKLNVKGVKEISVISTSDKIISSTNEQNVGKWITKSKKELVVKADLGETVTGSGPDYNVIIPVVVNSSHMGYINLTLSADDFSVFLHTSLVRRILAASSIFLFGIGMSVLLAHRYSKPIKEVVAAAKMVASGELDQEISSHRKDEIGELSRSFNYMVGKLREERQLSERLRKAEHLAGISQFSRSIAHEIKNPLNFINLSIDHIRGVYRPDDPTNAEKFETLLMSMKGEIRRVSMFAESFLEYSRPLELNRRKTNLGDLLESAIEIVSAKAHADNVRIIKDFNALPELVIDPEFISTCLYNVLMNSFQAMPGGGTLTLSAKQQGGYVIITVTDTGIGISKDKAEKVFDPLFSTKKDGLGIGLSLTKRVVEEHGGKVSFHSSEGEGSTITISIPKEPEG